MLCRCSAIYWKCVDVSVEGPRPRPFHLRLSRGIFKLDWTSPCFVSCFKISLPAIYVIEDRQVYREFIVVVWLFPRSYFAAKIITIYVFSLRKHIVMSSFWLICQPQDNWVCLHINIEPIVVSKKKCVSLCARHIAFSCLRRCAR